MPNKMGRPKKENPMNARIEIRVTQGEKEEIMKFSRENGFTILDLIRLGIERVKNL